MYVHQDTPLGPGEGARPRTRVACVSALPGGRTERFGRLGLIGRCTHFAILELAKESIKEARNAKHETRK